MSKIHITVKGGGGVSKLLGVFFGGRGVISFVSDNRKMVYRYGIKKTLFSNFHVLELGVCQNIFHQNHFYTHESPKFTPAEKKLCGKYMYM